MCLWKYVIMSVYNESLDELSEVTDSIESIDNVREFMLENVIAKLIDSINVQINKNKM